MLVIPSEATNHYKRQCEYKRLEVLCGLLNEGDIVLDVGCGIGAYTSNPLSYLPINITAIDSDQKTIKYANEKNEHKNLEFKVSLGEYFDTDLRYDVIICSHILEHVPTPLMLLGNMKRLLKDDGLFYVAIPNGFGWLEIQNFIPRMLWKTSWGKKLVMKMMGGKAKDTLNVDSQHINFFTIGRIRRVLKNAGWQVKEQINDEILGGIVLDRILSKLPSIAGWNTEVADRFPAQLANGWIFICEKKL